MEEDTFNSSDQDISKQNLSLSLSIYIYIYIYIYVCVEKEANRYYSIFFFSIMAEQSMAVSSVDPSEQFIILRKPDGTITLKYPAPEIPPTGDDIDADVFTKDVPLNEAKGTSVRIYRPRNATKGSKLPLIIFYHGGGFILFSVASLPYNEQCIRMAREFPAIIVSIDYRLAPEHRLPAAYEDGVEAVQWIKNQASGEPWLRDYVDFSKCFIMGSSAGGTMVYHVALRLYNLGLDQLQPLKIIGLILNQPFFGAVQRTASELRLLNDKILPLSSTDLMWDLSLPIGTDRDHEYCNPLPKGLSELEIKALKSQSCLVCFMGEDPLMDGQKEFMKMLEESGVKFVKYFDEKSYHAIEIFEPEKGHPGLSKAIKEFIYQSKHGY
ncbi:probable carboxylesterase 8 [Macadamia integrifolia]|uniref:probable carboxylesterase 8 n=1 Tax=Macadamia integrifolia TaxID=60698 RepID=UPI001C4FFD9E|nr:probable carboxylesterase 8 [Macadamia integrifolia]